MSPDWSQASISQRLEHVRRKIGGLTFAAFRERLLAELPEGETQKGLSYGAIQNYHTHQDGGPYRMPPADYLALVCEVFDVRAEWLLRGRGLPTPEEQAVAEAHAEVGSLRTEAAEGFAAGLPGFLRLGPGGAALWNLWNLIARSTRYMSDSLTFAYDDAKRAADCVRAPLDVLGFDIAEAPEDVADAYVAQVALALHALIRGTTPGRPEDVADPVMEAVDQLPPGHVVKKHVIGKGIRTEIYSEHLVEREEEREPED
jgi:hypothetical protein